MPPQPQPGDRLRVLGDEYTIQLGAEATGGAYALVETLCNPGGGTPLHVHSREDEAFYILDGEIEFRLGDQFVTATAGMALHAPRNVPHYFANRTNSPARLLVTMLPGGGEAMFYELASLPPGPPDMDALLEITRRYGIELIAG